MSEERQALLRAYAPAASASASKRSMAHLQSPSPPSSPSQAQLLLESEEAHSLALGRAVERRLSSLRSMTVIATLLFVFSTSVMALGTTEFNSSDTRHWFVALLSVAVTLSAYALLTYLVHAAVCDRLVAEGVPEYAWRLLVKVRCGAVRCGGREGGEGRAASEEEGECGQTEMSPDDGPSVPARGIGGRGGPRALRVAPCGLE